MGRTPCALSEFQHWNNFNSIAAKNLTPRNRGILCREPCLWTWCQGLMRVHRISTGVSFYNRGHSGRSAGCVHFVARSTPYKVQYANWSNATNITNLAMLDEESCHFCREELGLYCPVPIFSKFAFYLRNQLQWQVLWHCYASRCSIDSIH